MALHLDGCPTFIQEIEDQILQLLQPADLYRLALVNKALHAAAEPHLYSNITWMWGKAEPPPIVSCLNTILHRPELASYIRSLTILTDPEWSGFGPPCLHSDSGRRALFCCVPADKIHIVLVYEAIKAIQISGIEDWSKDVLSGKLDALLALFLSQLHALRELYIAMDVVRSAKHTHTTLRAAINGVNGGNLPTFAHLRRATCLVDNEYEVWNLVDGPPDVRSTATLDLLQLPRLEQLAFSWDDSPLRPWPGGKPFMSHTLTSLNVFRMEEDVLADLLACMPRLAHFAFTIYRDQRTNAIIDLDTIGEALSLLQHTLKTLSIKAQYVVGDDNRSYLTSRGTLRKLAKFACLQRLELPYQLLASSFSFQDHVPGRDIVPLSIKELRINHDLYAYRRYRTIDRAARDDRWLDSQLVLFIQVLIQCLIRDGSALRLLELSLPHTGDHYDPDAPWVRRVPTGHRPHAVTISLDTPVSRSLRETCDEYSIELGLGYLPYYWRLEGHVRQSPLGPGFDHFGLFDEEAQGRPLLTWLPW